MSTQDDSRGFLDHQKSEQRQRDFRTKKEKIQKIGEKCARALAESPGRRGRKHFYFVAHRMAADGGLLDLLLDSEGKWPEDYDEISEVERKDSWDFNSIAEFHENPEAFTRAVAPDAGQLSPSSKQALKTHMRGYSTPEESARVCIEGAFNSLAAIAEYEGIVDDEFRNRADAVGYTLKTGEHLQDWGMDLGETVRTIPDNPRSLMTLFAGIRGQGKSNGLEVEAEDFYQQNFRSGRDFKLIDLLGFRDGETWFYDLPQQQEDLRDVRDDQNLVSDFTDTYEECPRCESTALDRDDQELTVACVDEDCTFEGDEHVQPKMEILAPLTPGLTDEEIPFDTEDEEFVVRPFTVPASELRKPLLVSLIMSRLSDGEEQTIRQAYDDLDTRNNDWSLKDLADEIRSKDELSPSHKAKATGVLRSLQNEGFIRTKDDPYTIDWGSIFTTPEIITVFTQAYCEDEISRLLSFAYLTDAIIDERENRDGIPDCALIMRELWKVTPHGQRQLFDERSSSLQEAITGMFTKVFRDGRHSGIHLLADTQQISDLHKSVRELFNRYVIYTSDWDTVKDVFSWTQNNKRETFWKTITAKTGQAGIVGHVQPAIDEKNIEYLSPVEYTAPSHHHRDGQRDRTGWHARCKYTQRLDCCNDEVLKRPSNVGGVEWDDQIPTELQIDAEQESDEGPDVNQSPVAAFVERAVTTASLDGYVHKRDLYDAFNEFLKKHRKDRWDFDQKSKQTLFANRFKDAFPEDIENKKRKGEYAFIGVALTNLGDELLDNARTEVESVASPIAGDD